MTPQERQDFFDAIEGMAEPERLSLYNFSAKRLQGSGYSSGMDLLHEAISRLVSGSRKWASEIPIAAFLYEAMRSIASVERRHPERRPLPLEDWMEPDRRELDERRDPFARAPDEMLSIAQEVRARRQVIDSARARMVQDELAQLVFEGLALGLEASEIRHAYGIGELDHKSARARIADEIRRADKPPSH